jgi:hypothetical protein
VTAAAKPAERGTDSAATDPKGLPPAVAPWLTKRQRILQLHAELVTERSSFISHWQSINRVLFPRRGRFTLSDANQGGRRDQDIVDSTATFAARTAASGIMSGTTSPAREWFRLTTADPELADRANVKDFLHALTQEMRTLLAQSNFYDVIHTVYGDMVVYGTSPFLMEDDDEDFVRFEVFPVGSYCLSTDHKRRVRTFTREFTLTTEQMVGLFGYDQCSPNVQNAWRTAQLNQRWPIVHAITQNLDYDPSKGLSKYKQFYSCYIEQSSTAGSTKDYAGILRERGYDEFPILAARWDCTAEDVYATDCPGMTALGDIKQLQLGEKRALEAIDKLVRPPLVAPPSLANAAITQIPGGVTFDGADGKAGVRPLWEIKPELDKLEMKQQQVRERIREAFYANVFLMTSYLDEIGSKQPRTAAEIAVREQEKLMALGPVLQRLDRDVYNNVIGRLFNMMYRAGRLPDIPPELENKPLKVEYISILHAAQKSGGLGALERFFAFASGIAVMATEDQTGALMKIDIDQALDEHADMSGIPPRVVRPDDEVAAMRKAQADAKQKAQEAATLAQTAKSAKDLAAAPTDGKNALTDTLSGIASAANGGGPVGGGAQ